MSSATTTTVAYLLGDNDYGLGGRNPLGIYSTFRKLVEAAQANAVSGAHKSPYERTYEVFIMSMNPMEFSDYYKCQPDLHLVISKDGHIEVNGWRLSQARIESIPYGKDPVNVPEQFDFAVEISSWNEEPKDYEVGCSVCGAEITSGADMCATCRRAEAESDDDATDRFNCLNQHRRDCNRDDCFGCAHSKGCECLECCAPRQLSNSSAAKLKSLQSQFTVVKHRSSCSRKNVCKGECVRRCVRK